MSEGPSSTGADVEDDGPLTVRDDQLPDDVQPGDDNPLAEPAGEEAPDALTERGVDGEASDSGSGDAATRDDDASGTSSLSASSESARP